MFRTFLLLWWVAPSCLFSQSNFIQLTKTFTDPVRNRELVTEIWLPADTTTAQFPLVLFSHGTGGNRLACRWFCEGLAGEGFMVAAVDHYGNTFDNPIPQEFVTIWQRPQDITFVLSQLLQDKTVSRQIDTSKIVAAGFSIGGYTALALAGAKIDWNNIIKFIHTPQGYKEVNIPEMPGLIKMFEQENINNSFNNAPNLKDARIKAVFVMAPAAGQGFSSKKQMNEVKVPVYIVGAASDSIAPVKTNAAHYKKLIPRSKAYLIKGKAGHYVFLNEGTDQMKDAAPVFFKDADGVVRRNIHKQVVSKASRFFLRSGS